MRLRSIIRALALLTLGMMMFVRTGPLCETMAIAAPPVASHVSIADCERSAPARGTQREVGLGACAGACVATETDRLFVAAAAVPTLVIPAAAEHPALQGRTDRPVPPPPRTA
ncbi:hypothetical protein [Sphingomonas mucosissima]|nr:hypothetical protein [Sphingomonas mucosissima]